MAQGYKAVTVNATSYGIDFYSTTTTAALSYAIQLTRLPLLCYAGNSEKLKSEVQSQ